MAETQKTPKLPNGIGEKARGPSRSQQMNKLYALPAPVRTFPLPSFVPHNPISLLQLIYTWVSQTINPPSSHPELLYEGWWSPETRSIHVTDPRSIQALWQQGFYGKGSLSRSELSWLDREKRRRGDAASKTSEEVTRQRRAERQQVKWERARKEREAIDLKLQEERAAFNIQDDKKPPLWMSHAVVAPVGPLELLALPNSENELGTWNELATSRGFDAIPNTPASPETETQILSVALREEITQVNEGTVQNEHFQETQNGVHNKIVAENTQVWRPVDPPEGLGITNKPHLNGVVHLNGTTANNGALHKATPDSPKSSKSQKCVRFSPQVERTTFIQSEPPSPDLAAISAGTVNEFQPVVIQDKEHLQLTMEETFFLCYGLGVMNVYDTKSNQPIQPRDLFYLFRHWSYFPPSEVPLMAPDDPFMVSYVVYHHFRSLGWVVRAGTKFSVDFLLYNRGPVFSHAEFAIMIIPSYSDPFWSADANTKEHVAKMQSRSWSWLHCVNRVNSQVKKTLVLVYVDIPPPISILEEDALGINGNLKRYKVREIVLKRWLSNRSRD